MKTKKLIMGFVAIAAIGLFFNSCKKDDQDINPKPKPEPQAQSPAKSASDNAIAESAFGGIFNQADKAARNTDGKDLNSGCPSITINPISSFPMTITLDFGSSCLGDDGKTRSGKIIAVLTAPYIDSASVLTISLDNYHEIVNGVDYSVQGSEVITNIGRNSEGHRIFDVLISNGVVTSVNGSIYWSSHRQNEWIQGDDTWINVFDDIYHVTGSASGTNSAGETFQINITSPLQVQIGCAYIQSGTLELLTQVYPPILVDYGTGECDNIAIVTCNGYTFTIYM
jgi:hypothetical protein